MHLRCDTFVGKELTTVRCCIKFLFYDDFFRSGTENTLLLYIKMVKDVEDFWQMAEDICKRCRKRDPQ